MEMFELFPMRSSQFLLVTAQYHSPVSTEQRIRGAELYDFCFYLVIGEFQIFEC